MKEIYGKSIGENNIFSIQKYGRYLYVNGSRAKIFMKPQLTCTRIIYIFHNILFKFDVSDSKFVPQGQREVLKYYGFISENDKRYFTKPIDWGLIGDIYWVAQEFEEMISPKEESEIIERLIHNYNLNDVLNYKKEHDLYSDLFSWNWAFKKNGEPIIYDYAR